MANSTQGNKTIPQMTPIAAAITTGMLFHAWDPQSPVGSRDVAFPVSLLLNTSLPQNANLVYAGPGSGVPATPTFRSLVVADLPVVDVPHGGTGRATLGANGVLIGEGTAGVNVTSAGTAGQALVSGGAGVDPAFGVTKPVGGGTGLATLTARAVLIGEGTANVAFASPGTAGQMLLSAGAAADPAFGNNPTITGGTIDGSAVGGTTAAAGKFTTLQATAAITPSSTAGIVGTTTNDNANAGSVGEYLSNTALASAVSTTVALNAASISLTAGDWDVSGVLRTTPAGTTVIQQTIQGISTTSATLGAFGTFTVDNHALPANFGGTETTPVVRISVSATTTVFLIAVISFSTSTCTVDGLIRARRVR